MSRDRNFFDKARQAFGIPSPEDQLVERRMAELMRDPLIVDGPRIMPLNLWGDEPEHLADCESGRATLFLVHSLEKHLVARAYSSDEVEVSKIRLCCLACGQKGSDLLETGNPLEPESLPDALMSARSLILRAVLIEQLRTKVRSDLLT
ncbi:hypothetical protein HY024_02770 [Candidatus Curtissbacteria bacterium]|nr:hypothetical protein [Candidatus Curtissbacteria bacterium]